MSSHRAPFESEPDPGPEKPDDGPAEGGLPPEGENDLPAPTSMEHSDIRIPLPPLPPEGTNELP